MAEYQLPTPWGIADDASGGTTPEDMQQLTATRYEFRKRDSGQRGGIIRHSGPTGDGNGVEMRPDATLRCHMGSVLLDVAENRCVEAAVPYVATVDPGLAVGTAGTVTVAVALPAAGSNNARLITTTAASVSAAWVVLDKIKLPAGWTRTNQGTRVHDKEYAVLQGTANGELSSALDADSAARIAGRRYKRLAQSFVVPTDCNISLALSTTLRACWEDGSGGVPMDRQTTAVIVYEVFLDGALHTSFERPVSGIADTTFLETIATIGAGRHEVWVESYFWQPVHGTAGDNFWQVMQGGARKHRGDFLRVRHEGVRW